MAEEEAEEGGEEAGEEGGDGGWSFGVDAAAEYFEKGLLARGSDAGQAKVDENFFGPRSADFSAAAWRHFVRQYLYGKQIGCGCRYAVLRLCILADRHSVSGTATTLSATSLAAKVEPASFAGLWPGGHRWIVGPDHHRRHPGEQAAAVRHHSGSRADCVSDLSACPCCAQ